MAKRIKVEEGSGNVFADIGLPNPEEALAKAEIARRVNRILADRGLSQVQAGAVLGIPQPRVSDLVRGRLAKFSLEKLIDFAKRMSTGVAAPAFRRCAFRLWIGESSAGPQHRRSCTRSQRSLLVRVG